MIGSLIEDLLGAIKQKTQAEEEFSISNLSPPGAADQPDPSPNVQVTYLTGPHFAKVGS